MPRGREFTAKSHICGSSQLRTQRRRSREWPGRGRDPLLREIPTPTVLQLNGVGVGAELCPELAKVVQASERRRLGEIDDAPDDGVNHLGIP